MPENTWTLNDSVPITLAQTFEPVPPEQQWALNSIVPLSITQTFAPEPPGWSDYVYYIGLGMVQTSESGAPSLTISLVTTDEDDTTSVNLNNVCTFTLATADESDSVTCSLSLVHSFSLATIDEQDTVSCSAKVIISAAVATIDEDDIVSAGIGSTQDANLVCMEDGSIAMRISGKLYMLMKAPNRSNITTDGTLAKETDKKLVLIG